ncbi:restriction endonuclease subunit S [Bacillus cereus]|nr:restriction endonuclease subunit S [Bacillus cereus]
MSKNIPEVRFEGFSEDWSPINLSELMDFSNGINAPKESYGKGRKMISVMDILDESYLKYENIRSSVEVSPSIEEKNKVEYGDLIFVRSSEVSEEVGWSKAYLEKEYALYSGFSIRGKKKGSFNSSFVELSLNYTNRKQIERKAGGSTRFNISQTILNTIEILKASYEEQQKIGDFFKQLDVMIALQQQLVKQQQQYKKAMLQKMFPQKGERVPKVRFAGFIEDWKKGQLENFLVEYIEKTTIENEYTLLSSTNNGIEERNGRVSGLSNIGYKIIRKGNMVLSPQNLWLGNINYNSEYEIGIVSPSYKTFNIIQSDNYFISTYLRLPIMLKKYAQSSLQGASIVRRNLDMDLFNQITIFIPSQKEQQKIGAFFKQLDDTIALHEKKLEDYRQLKKTLLQRMFV